MDFEKGEMVCCEQDAYGGGSGRIVIKAKTPMVFWRSNGKVATCLFPVKGDRGIRVFVGHDLLRPCEQPLEVDIGPLMKLLEVE